MQRHHYYLNRIVNNFCEVCGDLSSGKHYNIFACDGCAGFFKRSIRSNRQYICRSIVKGACFIDKLRRNQCRACRLKKCQEAGMNKDAVQLGRDSRKKILKCQEIYKDLNRPAMTFLPSKEVPQGSILRTSLLNPKYNNILRTQYFLHHTKVHTGMSSSSSLVPPIVNSTDLCECAAQLLFINLQWINSILSCTMLPFSDRLLMIEESWKELFVLSAAQYLPVMKLSQLLHTSKIRQHKRNYTASLQNVQEFQDILDGIRQYQLDHNEFAYLKAIVLFRTSQLKSQTNARPLNDPVSVANIQENIQMNLNKYVNMKYSNQPLRFGKLLLLSLSLKYVSHDGIEELFFRETIGTIPVVNVIINIYKTQFMQNL